MTSPRVTAAVAIGALLLAGCGQQTATASHPSVSPAPSPTPTPSPSPSTLLVIGAVDVFNTDGGLDKGKPCSNSAGYTDIAADAQVTVKNASGATIALGSLGNGIGTNEYNCEFALIVPAVPDLGSAGIYSVHVGNVNRGEISYTRDQLKSGISLTIGTP